MHRSGLDLVLLNIIITDLEEGISSTLIKFEEDLKQELPTTKLKKII